MLVAAIGHAGIAAAAPDHGRTTSHEGRFWPYVAMSIRLLDETLEIEPIWVHRSPPSPLRRSLLPRRKARPRGAYQFVSPDAEPRRLFMFSGLSSGYTFESSPVGMTVGVRIALRVVQPEVEPLYGTRVPFGLVIFIGFADRDR